MHVFLSWSGEQSRELANALREYLPLVIQSVTPWFSPEDIDKGSRWLSELSAQLQKQSVAIVCVTPESSSSPWLLFEAGALSKALEMSWVCPVLLGIEPSEVKGPLAQFQATRATKTDIRALLGTINKRLEAPLSDGQIDKLHDLLWPDLEARLAGLARAIPKAASPHRTQNDLLMEVLERVRALERKLDEQPPSEVTLTPYLSRSIAFPKNVRRYEAPAPDSEALLAKFSARAALAEKTISEIERMLLSLPDGPSSKRSELGRQLDEERSRLTTFNSEVKRYAAKLERASRMGGR
jgi:hypothetical protein